ncbi:hypothetical protein F4861DRAFT_179608 [Xylaria intraflava]|nr:hypothetical protein F4861DRAFT_179608 [Xylaria intraflava]
MASHNNNPTASSPEPAEIDAIPGSVPPTRPQRPESECDEKANTHNASILAIRGLRTTATGDQLYNLANAALNNDVISTSSPTGARANNAGESPSISERRKDAEAPEITFEPFYFFFYGSLQIHRVLCSVCGLDKESPSAIRAGARLQGWKIKMWGPYPTLVPAAADDDDDGKSVAGSVWWCDKPDYVARLCQYETDAYRMAYCDVAVPSADGSGVEVLANARTFVSTLPAEHLDEGDFDAEKCEAFMRSF